jgi:hypothetical protein
MPFYIISRVTNGELRSYSKSQAEHFFYELNCTLHQSLYEAKYETLLKVRTGVGLKLVGIFGNYRLWKGLNDQIEMLACESSRKYVFEFIIEGKVSTPWTIVQFSVLYTDIKGNRYFKVVTHKIGLSPDPETILGGVNY